MIVLFLLFYFSPVLSEEIHCLNGRWKLENHEKGYKNLIAKVPGGIYSDLMLNKIIPDVFHGSNDVKSRWVGETNWKYSRNFTISSNYMNYAHINLILDGIDTFSTITINDVKVASTGNMFIKYSFDVKPYLKIGHNKLSIELLSPIHVAQNLSKDQSKSYTVPPSCVPSSYNGECHVNEIRKMQASFAWDWGPAFPSVGIWKNIYLNAYNSNLIKDVMVNTVLNEATNSWDINLETYLNRLPTTGNIQVDLSTELKNFTTIFNMDCKEQDDDLRCLQSFSIPQLYVKKWWPNGYGEASLYHMKVTYLNKDKKEVSYKQLKIGFRTIELVQDKLVKGRTFYFKVNNVPIFAKGSNVIPISILPEQIANLTTVKFLLKSAKDTHMNMLRVWGGGAYNSDQFYEIADEMGVLIWQDFMFACAMYPTKPDYLESVRTEVRQQVKRLQHHPSIAVWAGNNENEAALRGNWYGTGRNYPLYSNDYIKLYVHTIMNEVEKLDPLRPFLLSSPTNGIETIKQGYIAKSPYSHIYGDLHYYDYYSDGWDANHYPVTRFCSEYGFQSLPSVETILTATNSLHDLCLKSDFILHRQHLGGGNWILESLVQSQFPTKSTCEEFIYHSQIYQAVAIKVQTEFYRQYTSILNDAGEGLTMGAMYWQLNDVWVAPTWAGIDSQLRWKMLHYYAKRFFAPIIVTGFIQSTKQLDLYLVCDLPNVKQDLVELHISFFNWNSLTPVYEDTIKTTLLPSASKVVKSYANIDKFIEHATMKRCSPKTCFMYLELLSENGTSIAPENFIFLSPLKSATLSRANVKVKSIEKYTSEKVFKIILSTDNIALFVWLNVKGVRGQFSENGFLQVTPTKEIFFEAEQPVTVSDLQKFLTVTHLTL